MRLLLLLANWAAAQSQESSQEKQDREDHWQSSHGKELLVVRNVWHSSGKLSTEPSVSGSSKPDRSSELHWDSHADAKEMSQVDKEEDDWSDNTVSVAHHDQSILELGVSNTAINRAVLVAPYISYKVNKWVRQVLGKWLSLGSCWWNLVGCKDTVRLNSRVSKEGMEHSMGDSNCKDGHDNQTTATAQHAPSWGTAVDQTAENGSANKGRWHRASCKYASH